ncbi:MAG: UDP-N-acetylmuramoyl-L-alanyl-D-glutamate--2,6-diaminopimelate ligase [Bdellovibrionales bacterium]|nr:UDP-N-acetylmuramoyl-L-alanyl-D-glutamate--2,6-diaminopimelate ligase [Bdellovibrionales bacterium]
MYIEFANSCLLEELQKVVGGTLVPNRSGLSSVNAPGMLTQLIGATGDSREVKTGTLFVAYRGVQSDGHAFIQRALSAGATAVVLEDEAVAQELSVPTLIVPSGRSALSALAAWASGNPTAKLLSIAITGTNGKTTIQWLLSEALAALGERPLRIGTLGISFEGEVYAKGETTTPTAQEVQFFARKALESGATALVMETSSHGLQQGRVDHVEFRAGIFTNLSPDHLDYHPDMQDYMSAKRVLFELLLKRDPECPAIIGVDDQYGIAIAEWGRAQGQRVVTFGFEPTADVVLERLQLTTEGLSVVIRHNGETFHLTAPLIGRYNAQNAVAAFLVLLELGFPPERLVPVFRDLKRPPGRMEYFEVHGAGVFVDYAHSTEALRTALTALRPVTQNRLCVLFGCGGDRDPRRRAGMGHVAKECADVVVITSDNPRSEDPEKIIRDILASGVSPNTVQVDRRKAIEGAIRDLKPGDVLLVAGKGHEDYQIIGEQVSHFSDREEVIRVIREIEHA